MTTDPFAPSFFDSTCRKCICRHVHILFQTCNSDTREDARTYMTDFTDLNRHGVSLLSVESSCLLPDPCEDFCSSPSVCFSVESDAGEDECRFCLWPLPLFPVTLGSWLKLHESPLELLSVCLPLKTLSHFPLSVGFLSFFDSWWLILFPQHRSGPCSVEFSSSDQYEVLQLSSIVDSSAPCFAPFLGHTKPTQSEAEQNFSNFDLYDPSRIHLSADHVHARPCFFKHAALQHLLFSGNVTACWEAFFKADAIIASIISKSGKSFSSIDYAISTSLIESIVIWGSAVLR